MTWKHPYRQGYFDFTETQETYEVVLRLSPYHRETVVDIRGELDMPWRKEKANV